MLSNPFKKKTKSDSLISPEYSALLTEKHDTDAEWGSSGPRFADRVIELIITSHSETILDYGCGKGALAEVIKSQIDLSPALYDPGIKKHSKLPEPADFVICTDVLEHIEPELIDNVLSHLAHLTKREAYFVIFTGDCGHKLPDGRAAHLIQKPRAWWEGKLLEVFGEYFDFSFADTGLPHRFEVVITRRAEPMTEEEALARAEEVAKILAGEADPEPDLSAIEAVEGVDMPKGGFGAGFGNINKYREG